MVVLIVQDAVDRGLVLVGGFRPICLNPSARKVTPYSGLIISPFLIARTGERNRRPSLNTEGPRGPSGNEVPMPKIKIVLSVLKVMTGRTNRPT